MFSRVNEITAQRAPGCFIILFFSHKRRIICPDWLKVSIELMIKNLSCIIKMYSRVRVKVLSASVTLTIYTMSKGAIFALSTLVILNCPLDDVLWSWGCIKILYSVLPCVRWTVRCSKLLLERETVQLLSADCQTSTSVSPFFLFLFVHIEPRNNEQLIHVEREKLLIWCVQSNT